MEIKCHALWDGQNDGVLVGIDLYGEEAKASSLLYFQKLLLLSLSGSHVSLMFFLPLFSYLTSIRTNAQILFA